MNYRPLDTSNVDQTLTPRVRTIFRTRPASAPASVVPAAQPASQPATGMPAEKGQKQLSWHDLVLEILESLFPFPEAYTVVRQTMDAFGAKLPAPT